MPFLDFSVTRENRELKNHDESHDDDIYIPLKDWSDDVSSGRKKKLKTVCTTTTTVA